MAARRRYQNDDDVEAEERHRMKKGKTILKRRTFTILTVPIEPVFENQLKQEG